MTATLLALACLVLAVLALLLALHRALRSAAQWKLAARYFRDEMLRWQTLAAQLEAEKLLRGH